MVLMLVGSARLVSRDSELWGWCWVEGMRSRGGGLREWEGGGGGREERGGLIDVVCGGCGE